MIWLALPSTTCGRGPAVVGACTQAGGENGRSRTVPSCRRGRVGLSRIGVGGRRPPGSAARLPQRGGFRRGRDLPRGVRGGAVVDGSERRRIVGPHGRADCRPLGGFDGRSVGGSHRGRHGRGERRGWRHRNHPRRDRPQRGEAAAMAAVAQLRPGLRPAVVRAEARVGGPRRDGDPGHGGTDGGLRRRDDLHVLPAAGERVARRPTGDRC